MKAKEQQLINDTVQMFLDRRFEEIMLSRCIHQLDSCTAWTGEYNGLLVLQSYQTKVAVYDSKNNVFYDFLRLVYGYSATSAKHIAKFRNKYCDNETVFYTYRVK